MPEPAAFTPAPVSTVTAQAPFSAGPHVLPSFDFIELLPPGAADRLRMLRQRSNDMHALCVPHADLQEATALKHDAQRALSRLVDHRSLGGYELPQTDNRVIAAEKHLAKLSDDWRRLNERREARAAAWQTASQALAAVESWLRDGKPSGVLLQDHDGEEPKLNKGETVVDAIERHRRRSRELRADLHRIESAPFPSSHTKLKMREQIDALAMQGAPSVSSLIEHDGRIDFQTQRVQSQVIGAEQRALAFAELPDAVALVAWLHKDMLIKRLDAEIDAEADVEAALSHEAREKAEAEVLLDIVANERDESFFVFSAQAQGLPCEHRSDISPVALLNLKLVTVAPTNGHGSSSEQHASFSLIGGR